jgi:prolyl-tRNA synthetase
LILPPRLAPIQVVIIPIYKSDSESATVMETVNRLQAELKAAGIRLKLDDRTEVTPGYKFNDWELRGVPLRIEVGPRDVEKGTVAIARRDRPGREGKTFIPQAGLTTAVVNLLEEIQKSMLDRATDFRDRHILDPHNYAELTEVVQDGWAYSYWCESTECEAKVKEETKATTRCMPLDQPDGKGMCIVCGKEASRKVYFARAY